MIKKAKKLYGSKFKDDLDKEMTPVDFDGVWYNRDIFEIVNNSKYEQVVYLEECVAKNSASLLSNKIIDKNFAYNLYTYNCVHFAVELWNLVVSSDKRIDTCLTPDNLETEINKQSGAVSISSGHLADLPVNTCSYYDGSVLQSYTFRGEEQ